MLFFNFVIVFHIIIASFLLKSKYYLYLNVCTHPRAEQQSQMGWCLNKVFIIIIIIVIIIVTNCVQEIERRVRHHPCDCHGLENMAELFKQRTKILR